MGAFVGAVGMGLRFAFDMGTNSIGWAVFEIERHGETWALRNLLNAGVRIFSDGRNPKDGTSLAEARRLPRGMRRRRDRYLQRRKWLTALLTTNGLPLPRPSSGQRKSDLADPWALRAKALDAALSPEELARVFFHLNQRRGFKSNRRTDRGKNEDESGKIAEGAKRLRVAMTGTTARTLGEWLAKRRTSAAVRSHLGVRVRLDGSGSKALYEFYPTRDMIETEFNAIWLSQSRFHPTLRDQTLKARIHDAIFYQRPLRPVPVGRCTFNHDEPRIAKATPLAQALRIYQDLSHIRVTETPGSRERRLTIAELQLVASELLAGADIKYRTSFRRILGLGPDARINLELHDEKELKGASTTAALAGSARKPGPLHDIWHTLTVEQQDSIVVRLLDSEDPVELSQWLTDTTGCSAEQADAAGRLRLQPGYMRLGRTAATKILEALQNGAIDARGEMSTITYSEACMRAGFHHSARSGDGSYNRLPYYGAAVPEAVMPPLAPKPNDTGEKRYGKIANPTVHIGLNQLRRITNKLIDVYGKPDQIVLELARDLKTSEEERKKITRRNEANERANVVRDEILASVKVEANGANRGRLKLWEELSSNPSDRLCPFSGRLIPLSLLFTDAVEIEHILPYSRTLDDSPANRTLAFREWNRLKRGKSPAEAAETFPDKFNLQDMMARAAAMPANKSWRFGPDAMQRWEKSERDFLARQLNDTRHLARVARSYMTSICRDVYVVTGQMTALLRGKWGLNTLLGDGSANRKERNDHRHHAIDAAVVGATDRALLQAISRAAARAEAQAVARVLADIPIPFEGFRERLSVLLGKLIVSHKLEHGTTASERSAGDNSTTGPLHEQTAYGLVRENVENIRRGELDLGNVVRRKPLADLTFKDIGLVRDHAMRSKLEEVAAAADGDTKKLSAGLAAWGAIQRPPVRRVRVLKPESALITISDRRTGRPYKAVVPSENHCVDIIILPGGSCIGIGASSFEINQPGWSPSWRSTYPGARLMMRLHKGDCVQLLDPDGKNRIKVVQQIRIGSSTIFFRAHNEGGRLQQRHDDANDTFRWDMASISKLPDRRARAVRVNEIGQVKPIIPTPC
jgi:CRISPR-associated endonuclease Csn1